MLNISQTNLHLHKIRNTGASNLELGSLKPPVSELCSVLVKNTTCQWHWLSVLQLSCSSPECVSIPPLPLPSAVSHQQHHVLITAKPSGLLLGVLTVQPSGRQQFEQWYYSLLRFVRINRREVLLTRNLLFFWKNPKQPLVFVGKE